MSDQDKTVTEDAVLHQGPAVPVRVRRSKRQAIVHHYKRFWWAHLLAVVLLTALAVPLIIYVAIPKIAQSKVDQAELELRSLEALDTRPTNFTLKIDAVVHTDGSVSADIDGFEGVMYLEDLQPQTPFARVQFPPTTSAAYQEVSFSQLTHVDDLNAFTTFNTWLLDNDTVRVTVKGDTNVHVRGISKAYGVNFKKTIEMKGLRKLQGIDVVDTKINLANDTRGNNFKATVVIPNHSQSTFEIGNATFTNYANGQDLGEVYIDNMTLKPGNNSLALRASVKTSPILQLLGQKPYCETGVVAMTLVAKEVTNHGEHLAYFADALKAANQTVELNLGAAIKSSLNLTIPCTNTNLTRASPKPKGAARTRSRTLTRLGAPLTGF